MKTAFITGGTKGIGFAITEKLLSDGYNVALTGRSEEGVKNARSFFDQSYPGKVLGIQANVQKYEDLKKAVTQTIAQFGQIDVLVANAGIGLFKNIREMKLGEWDDVIDTNLTGVFYTVKAALEEIIKQQGYIITIASLAGVNFFEKGTAYNASKFGLVGFTQALMLDVRDLGVKVSTIMPGSVSTYFNGNTPSEADKWKIQPEDLAQMVADLLKMNPRTLPSKIEVRPTRVSK